MKKLYQSWSARYLGACGISIALCAASMAHAQEVDPQPAEANPQTDGIAADEAGEDEPGYLDVVVVTAQLRSQDLSDVPISMEAVGTEELAEQNINSLFDISLIKPSVNISSHGRSSEIFIRGVGSGLNQFFDQSVGVFVDGVYRGRSRTTASGLFDLERVEILKGPQSLYFGNNAIGGAFSVVTASPGEEFSGNARILYGSYGQYAQEVAAGGRVADGVKVRLAALSSGSRGFLTNPEGGETPNYDTVAGRLTVVLDPTDNLEIILKGEVSEFKSDGIRSFQNINCPPPAPMPVGAACQQLLDAGVPVGTDNDFDTNNAGTFYVVNSEQASATVNYDFGPATLTSVSGYYGYGWRSGLDVDGTPFLNANSRSPENFQQFSQEFRVGSNGDGPLNYLAGVYYQTSELEVGQHVGFFVLDPVLEANFPQLAQYGTYGQRVDVALDEESYSAFGALTWDMTDRLSATAGLRYSNVERDVDQTVLYGSVSSEYGFVTPYPNAENELATFPDASTGLQGLASGIVGAPAGRQSQSRSDDAWQPSVNVLFEVTPEVNTYVSYSRGFKAGGFNGVDLSGVPERMPFEPEEVDAYEFGVKGDFFDGTLRANLALFRSEYSDLQTSVSLPGPNNTVIALVRNAADLVSQGVEVEGTLDFYPLRIDFSGTYLDTTYENFPNGVQSTIGTFCGTDYQLPFCAGFPNPTPAFQDLSGKRPPFAPEFSGSLTAAYEFKMENDWTVTPELTGIYSSEYFLTGNADPLAQQDSYTRLDARLGVTSPSGLWNVEIVGRNLTDETILVTAIGLSGANGTYTAARQMPRNVSAQVRYSF